MNKGFTLVELVIGIVVLAIAMMVMNTMLISQSKDALEPVYRLRASQLGQSIMQNILSRAYDENSDHNGGRYRCGEEWEYGGVAVKHPCSAKYGRDSGEDAGKHQDFNDVDDFITIDITPDGFVNAATYIDIPDDELSSQYNNYAVKIEVVGYTLIMKRIDVTIKTPSDEEIVFSALKGNY